MLDTQLLMISLRLIFERINSTGLANDKKSEIILSITSISLEIASTVGISAASAFLESSFVYPAITPRGFLSSCAMPADISPRLDNRFLSSA